MSESSSEDTELRHSWKEAFAVYIKPRVLVMLFLGFSAGLPFLLVFSTLITWLKDIQLDIALIGYFSFIGITYSIKIFWAPIVDNLRLPILTKRFGHRRSWMLLSQAGIATGLLAMAITDPAQHAIEMACFALLVAFSSATQDINIDAYRIEAAEREYQAAMASLYILGYRLAVLVSGAGALYIADFGSWLAAYISMAGLVSVGVITVFLIKEPTSSGQKKTLMPESLVKEHLHRLPTWFRLIFNLGISIFLLFFLAILIFFAILFPIYLLNSLLTIVSNSQLVNVAWFFDHYTDFLKGLFSVAIIVAIVIFLNRNRERFRPLRAWINGAVVGPFVDFFYRFGIIIAVMVLSLIAIYRLTDIFMASMAYTLYLDLGFSKSEIATITKVFGFIMTLSGAAAGGIFVMRYGIMRPLLLGALLVVVTNLLFSVLSTMGNDMSWLTIVIVADNFSAGLAQSAFIAYLSALVNKNYTATQYALFSSLMTLLGKFLSGFSGEIVKAGGDDGYFNFFIYASLMGIPAILLIATLIMMKHAPKPVEADTKDD